MAKIKPAMRANMRCSHSTMKISLYWSSVMLKLTFLNSGVSWYFPNSVCQACWLRGGIAPLTGFHSTIDRPERVRRTKPPNTTRNIANDEKENIQYMTGRCWVLGIYLSPGFFKRRHYSIDSLAPELSCLSVETCN